MRFLLILTQVEAAWAQAPQGEGDRVYQQYKELEQELKAKRKLVDSVRLRFSNEARTIRNLQDGTRCEKAGPYTDSKEVMGGYYVLECDGLDEAVEWARRMPNYGHGSIEVRPIWE